MAFILIILIVLAAMIAIPYAATQIINQRRIQWKRAADEHGLDFMPGPWWTAPTIFGTVDGIDVWIYRGPRGSDERGTIHYRIGYKPATHESFELTHDTGLDPDLNDFGSTHIGDREFDSVVRTKASNPEEIAAYLTAPRRAAVLELLNSDGFHGHVVTRSSIRSVKGFGIDDDRITLSSNIAMLLAAARALGETPQDQLALTISEPTPLDRAVDQVVGEEAAVDEAATIDAVNAEEPAQLAEPVDQQGPPLARETISFDQHSLMHDLFDSQRMGHETDELFSANYEDASVEFTGEVDTVRALRADRDFTGPGLKVTLILGYLGGVELGSRKVNAVVQLPEDAHVERGQTITITGTLIRVDRFTNGLYVANASIL